MLTFAVGASAVADTTSGRDLLARGFAHLYADDYVQTLESTTRGAP